MFEWWTKFNDVEPSICGRALVRLITGMTEPEDLQKLGTTRGETSGVGRTHVNSYPFPIMRVNGHDGRPVTEIRQDPRAGGNPCVATCVAVAKSRVEQIEVQHEGQGQLKGLESVYLGLLDRKRRLQDRIEEGAWALLGCEGVPTCI
jgi:hypothetical protein